MTPRGRGKLIGEILRLYTEKKRDLEARIREFKEMKCSSPDRLFEELVFCICTPQTKARAADNAVRELRETGALFSDSREEIAYILRKNGVRFHNNKARSIVEARKILPSTLPKVLETADRNPQAARDFLVLNVRGLGLKEASHFLRNIGYDNLAIIDRHILRTLINLGEVDNMPKTLTRRRYLEVEEKFIRLASKLGIKPAELDLVMWAMQTGEIFK
ncbi:MAG TPA: N-glycosylase/DNA lyase [Candidatus Caldiarchaeum subterraneum]|uniref:8-oxoguanine DNA glycosylase/AP lyase n=1 Tax=Caldiarchaeum subterraneum TaxID=311458 RepID=A0A832ZVZ5_CALS0|nr:N-glycosylase/DNA lyase [Candidatus Caldarchaeum subterraneum]